MKYYPIGTVVVLKEGTWPLMIYARQQSPKRNSEKVYDYVGCLYPQGYIDKNYIVFFEHKDIDTVLHQGMSSIAETEMEKMLHIPESA
ncbi:MAG: DUF4176 domain-containing protein [Clostridia bacterium]|nr:DUF4176 domain-containing protein [Clostridia bacterium]